MDIMDNFINMLLLKKLRDILRIFLDLRCFFVPSYSRAIPNLVRLKECVSLERYGIRMKFNNIPRGLCRVPYTIPFGEFLHELSLGEVDIEAVNSYVLGDYRKNPESLPELKGVANILDPTSKFKDTWFGTYIIFDDPAGKGRKFMLIDPAGSPGDPANFNTGSMVKISDLDQKLITWSSHENHSGYIEETHNKEFYYRQREKLRVETVPGPGGDSWLRIAGSFDTTSIIPDLEKTNMRLFSSSRGICGLPNDAVFELVEPWNKIIIHGEAAAKYFERDNIKFWALCYYCASEYDLKNGKHVNNWEETNVKSLLRNMFNSMTIEITERFTFI
ncbi:MAG: hypothetical protein GY754_26565 [bacterium]|nr:hypothetical protein [bacterium]